MTKSILLSLALTFFSSTSFALDQNSKVLIRFISTTWCGSCRGLHDAFLGAGYLPKESEKSDKTLMIGEMPLNIKSGNDEIQIKAKIEFFEDDIYIGTKKFENEPDLNSSVPYYPRLLIYIDGVETYAGFDGYYPSEEETQALSNELLEKEPDLKEDRAHALKYKIEQSLATLKNKK